ncbi:hypothetical protein ACVWZA_003927 [Sphingomonas sp. UYAg733]
MAEGEGDECEGGGLISLMLLTALQSATPIPTPSAKIPSAERHSPVTATERAKGIEIARLLNSETMTLRQVTTALDRDLPRQVAKDPNFQLAEEAYSGISKVIIDAMRPVILQYTTAKLPDMWEKLGGLYADALTEGEMTVALAFYRSQTGVWLIEQVIAGTDMSDMFRKTLANPDREMTAADLKGATTDKALPGVMKTMTPARSRDIMGFVLSPAGRKIRLLQPSLLKAAVDWGNQPDPAVEKQLQTVVEAAMDAFIANSEASGPKT